MVRGAFPAVWMHFRFEVFFWIRRIGAEFCVVKWFGLLMTRPFKGVVDVCDRGFFLVKWLSRIF